MHSSPPSRARPLRPTARPQQQIGPLPTQTTDPVGRCEAVLILPIEYDGVSSTARLDTEPPAPSAVARFGYEGFLDRICRLYQARFAS